MEEEVYYKDFLHARNRFIIWLKKELDITSREIASFMSIDECNVSKILDHKSLKEMKKAEK